MMRQWMGLCAGLLMMLVMVRAVAQTTQPAPELWGQTVQALAASLVSNDASRVLGSLVPEDAPLREMGSSRADAREAFVRRCEGMQAISARTYSWPATTIASDLAADIKACNFIPPSLANPFIPRDNIEAQKANAVARQWLASVMEPADGELLGVILLWEPPSDSTVLLVTGGTPPQPKPPLFVFIKGKSKEYGEVQITAISYGDAKQALK